MCQLKRFAHQFLLLCLAGIYSSGMAAEKSYFTEVYQRFEPLAVAGDADSQWLLGFMLDNRFVSPSRPAERMPWLRQAASRGFPEAQAVLADHYLLGEGVAQDCLQAYEWYEHAARQGHFRAALFGEFLRSRLTDCIVRQSANDYNP